MSSAYCDPLGKEPVRYAGYFVVAGGVSLPAPLGQGVGPSEEAVMVAGSLTPWLLLYNGNLEVNMLQHT